MSLFTNLLKKSLKEFLRKRRKLLITLTAIFVVLVGLNFVLSKYVDDVVGELVRDFVYEKSEGFYYVEFKEIGYVLNHGRFLMTDFEFNIHPDYQKNLDYTTLSKNYLYQASIPRLHIDIIDFWSIFIRRKLKVIGVEVNNPAVKITNLNKNKSPKKISFEAGNLYKALSVHLNELKINDFAIENGSFDFETINAPDYDDYHINGLTFRLENFQVNENSAERDDKIFYTDDIFLEVRDQELLLRDSIHKFGFEKFYLSTQDNELGFSNLRLTRRDHPLAEKKDHDHYEIHLPELRFAGIDFISAYNDNFLYIDSINIRKPDINLVKRTNKKTNQRQRNNFLDIAMMYHDYLEIDHFNLLDAQLSYRDETKRDSKKYSIDQITATLTNVKIDTGKHSSKNYGFDFNDIELVVMDYEVTLPDSVNTARFEELTIQSDPLTITLKDLSIQPETKRNLQPEKSKITAEVPFLVIKGFDILKAINDDTIDIQEFYIEDPRIGVQLTEQEKKSSQVIGPHPSGASGLLEGISSFSDLIALHKFLIKNGQLEIKGSSDKGIENVDLRDINLNLENLELDSITLLDYQFLRNMELDLSTVSSSISLNQSNIKFESIDFSSKDKLLNINELYFLSDTTGTKAELDLNIPQVKVAGLDIKEILLDTIIRLDTFEIDGAEAVLTQRPGGRKESSKSISLPVAQIDHLIGNSIQLNYKNEHSPIFIGKNIEVNIEGLVMDEALSDNPVNQFDYKKIHKISVDDYHFLLDKQQHLFTAGKISLTNDSHFSMERIDLMPINNPNNKYRVSVPKLAMSEVDFKKILKESYYSGGVVVIEKPIINLSLAEGRQKNPTNLDLGFIPLIMRNRFHGIKTQSFHITEGQLIVHQKTKGDSLLLECDNLNLTVEDFEVDSTTIMVPDRFLFANDVKLFGDYFTIYQQNKGSFTGINHFEISTRNEDLKFEGIYMSTNTRDNPDQSQTKVTVNYLNILNLDFFNLTQNRVLHLDEIYVDEADITLSPKPKKEITDIPSIDDHHPLPSDTTLMNDLERIMDYDRIFNQSQKSAETNNSGGLNIHEQDYYFDTLLLKQVDIDNVFIADSRLTIENAKEHRDDLSIMDIWIQAEGMKYDPVLAKDTSRIFYSDQINARLSNLEYILPDNLSSIKFDELKLNSSDSSIKIKHFMLDPRVSKFDYGPAKGFQSTWLRLENDSINIDKVDFLSIINNKMLNAEQIDVHSLDFEIYRDKRIEFPEWQRRPLPQTELHNIDFTIRLDTVNLFDSYIGYQEHAEKSNSPGEIFFTDLNASVYNISNDVAHLLKYPKTNISASTNVFGKGKIIAQFQFDMIDPDNIHTYGVEVDSFDLQEFNRILIPNASAQIKSGKNERIIMTAKANEVYSYGEMKFYYNDLKVQLLNRETETPRGLGNVLGSFFANTFIIRSNNPKNFVVRKGDIFFERDKKRAIFNYWTKTFLSGVVSSIGAANNKKKIKKMQEQNLKEIKQQKNENLTLRK